MLDQTMKVPVLDLSKNPLGPITDLNRSRRFSYSTQVPAAARTLNYDLQYSPTRSPLRLAHQQSRIRIPFQDRSSEFAVFNPIVPRQPSYQYYELTKTVLGKQSDRFLSAPSLSKGRTSLYDNKSRIPSFTHPVTSTYSSSYNHNNHSHHHNHEDCLRPSFNTLGQNPYLKPQLSNLQPSIIPQKQQPLAQKQPPNPVSNSHKGGLDLTLRNTNTTLIVQHPPVPVPYPTSAPNTQKDPHLTGELWDFLRQLLSSQGFVNESEGSTRVHVLSILEKASKQTTLEAQKRQLSILIKQWKRQREEVERKNKKRNKTEEQIIENQSIFKGQFESMEEKSQRTFHNNMQRLELKLRECEERMFSYAVYDHRNSYDLPELIRLKNDHGREFESILNAIDSVAEEFATFDKQSSQKKFSYFQ